MLPSDKAEAQLEIRAYSVKEMALLYKVCKLTFLKWIKPFTDDIGERNGHFYTVKQVKIIIEKLGMPDTIDTDN